MSLLLLLGRSNAHQQSANWAIAAPVPAQVLITFASMGRVNNESDLYWRQAQLSGASDITTPWGQAQLSGAASTGLEWHTHALVAKNTALAWDYLANVTADQRLQWFQGGWVFSTTQMEWVNLTRSGEFSIATNWTASATIGAAPQSVLWDARQRVQSSSDVSWNADYRAGRDVTALWHHLAYVTSPDLGLVWDTTIASGESSTALVWAQNALVTAEARVLAWAAAGYVRADIQALWGSDGPAVALLELVWDDLERVAAQRGVAWGATLFVPNPYLGAMVQFAGDLQPFSGAGPLVTGTMDGTARSMEEYA